MHKRLNIYKNKPNEIKTSWMDRVTNMFGARDRGRMYTNKGYTKENAVTSHEMLL